MNRRTRTLAKSIKLYSDLNKRLDIKLSVMRRYPDLNFLRTILSVSIEQFIDLTYKKYNFNPLIIREICPSAIGGE